MKLFAFIMAVMVLALTIMPCADAVAAIKSNVKTEIKAADQYETNHSDACSPFYQCSCCAGFSINHRIANLTVLEIYIRKPEPSLLPAKIIKVPYPFGSLLNYMPNRLRMAMFYQISFTGISQLVDLPIHHGEVKTSIKQS